jgi:hypothetical protein
MTRRRKIAAVGIVIVGLVLVGLGAQEKEPFVPWSTYCEKDLAKVFELCGSKGLCERVEDEFHDACQAGCVMSVCPAQITCTQLDPMWCGTSCADAHGARLWYYDAESDGACQHLFDQPDDRPEEGGPLRAWSDCRAAYMKERCPEFKGFRQEWFRDDDECREDLVSVFEYCAQPFECGEMPEEFVKACTAGCVMTRCPNTVRSTDLSTIAAAPCNDMYGGRFFQNLDGASARCNHKLRVDGLDTSGRAAYEAAFDKCAEADVERHCPELAGTDWHARYNAALERAKKK